MPAAEPISHLFVVPAVHPVNTLRAVIEADEQRLRLQRPTSSFSRAFMRLLRVVALFSGHREHSCRGRVSSVSQQLSGACWHYYQPVEVKERGDQAGHRTEAAHRETLPQELETHVCSDRNQGKLTVPLSRSLTLTALAATTMPLTPLDQECSGAEGQEEAGEEQDPSAESDSCDDIYADEECHVNRCVRQLKFPNALKERGDRIQKGMVVAVLYSAKEGEPIAGQPFWLAKVTRLSQMHITLWYYGDKFLGLYTPLRNPDRTKHIFQWLRDDITILHCNIKLTSLDRYGRGHLSAGDQKVLSLDDRVPWQLPTERKRHSSQRSTRVSATPAKRAAAAPPSREPSAKRGRRKQ